jgi:hypothetical protein
MLTSTILAPYLADLYRKIATRYVFMADDALKQAAEAMA